MAEPIRPNFQAYPTAHPLLHALDFAHAPRLFFRTPYSYEQICDWKDQALLHLLAGPVCTTLLVQHDIRRATQLCQDKLPDALKQHYTTIEFVKHDQNVQQLQAWKRCSSIQDT